MLSVSSSALARVVARSRAAGAAAASRGMAMKTREIFEELPPNFSMDNVKPPPLGLGESLEQEEDPMAYVRKPVTSAHSVDLSAEPHLSALDSAAFGPSGKIVHGRFGEVDAEAASSIPLEYLALLGPASKGAAALREISEASKSSAGTVLIYGASRPAGMAAAQLASSSGNAVVAVLDGQHSGNNEMIDIVKGLTTEPGTAVSEEYALCKANFRELVEKIVTGEDFISTGFNSKQFLSDFKTNLLDYIEAYPSDLPAAVDSEQLKFEGKEKDRANFRTNMDAYLSQFTPGADPIDPAKLDANFTVDQYEIFKKKFGIQTTAVISGGDGKSDISRFVPNEIVSSMTEHPETPEDDTKAEGDFPFEFSITNSPPSTAPTLKGGPIIGAVIEVTPDLLIACEAVSAGKTLREKAEALQFLTDGQRNAHAAAASVVGLAKKAGAAIRTVGGSLPGLDEIQAPGEADVKTALDAMAIGDDGTSRLNYFIQVYRASDFPVYEDYAIYRATEPLSGPRQIVVTK